MAHTVIPVLVKLRQKDNNFEDSLDYITSSYYSKTIKIRLKNKKRGSLQLKEALGKGLQ